jgi:predicted transcriptional regulator
MAMKEASEKLSVYVPLSRQDENIVERLIKLGAKKDRSVNYLVVSAIVEFLEREEAK